MPLEIEILRFGLAERFLRERVVRIGQMTVEEFLWWNEETPLPTNRSCTSYDFGRVQSQDPCYKLLDTLRVE